MTRQEQIKAEYERRCAEIKHREERIKELRHECKHPNTFEGNYSWRVGAIVPATICSDCGESIKIHF